VILKKRNLSIPGPCSSAEAANEQERGAIAVNLVVEADVFAFADRHDIFSFARISSSRLEARFILTGLKFSAVWLQFAA
jgi:hypothetical protein